MSDLMFPTQAEVFNLELSGSIGEFRVDPVNPELKKSVSVKYLQTHLSFDSSTFNQRLLENMVPVRELFEISELKFDELMQRNIDDSRVSNSLIPYLLKVGNGQAVRFFPPIITVALPIGENKRPVEQYPAIENKIEPAPNYGPTVEKITMTSGKGDEAAFEFVQHKQNGKLMEHDFARLKINTNKCRLVIVDGQHRAMALLAIYRNLKSWPDQSYAYKTYYRRWAASELQKVNLAGISLPIVVCTFPELAKLGDSPMKVTEACRSIFLALNKNARPVTEARNILLSDDDIIACFLRDTLEVVKQKDGSSKYAMRLWNFELDADSDKRAVASKVAFSGVMNIFNLVERLMLNNSIEVNGIHSDSKKYYLISNLTDCLKRLDGENLLGVETANSIRRKAFTKEAEAILRESFLKRYGNRIVEIFERFYPYSAMANAALKLETELRGNNDQNCLSMLFGGQGVYQVFKTYSTNFDSEVKEIALTGEPPAELKTINEDLKAINTRLQEAEKRFYQERSFQLLQNIPKYSRDIQLSAAVDELYSSVFSTSAFQTALFTTFFFNVEKQMSPIGKDDECKELFEDYIASLNKFFCPTNDKKADSLFETFAGKVQKNEQGFSIVQNAYCLRKILIAGELNPAEWTKFRYLLLELWYLNTSLPNENAVKINLFKDITGCRSEVYSSLLRRELALYCKQNALSEAPDDVKKTIEEVCIEKYAGALNDMGVKLKADEKRLIKSSMQIYSNSDTEESN